MGTGILFKRLWRTARLASAIGIAGLLAATVPPVQAQAASKASAECHGVLDESSSPGLPAGNFKEAISFTTGTPTTLGTTNKAQAVAGSFILTIDEQCTGFNPATSAASTVAQTPCVQAGTFTGSIDVQRQHDLGILGSSFARQAGTGLFDGCEETFLVMPVNIKTKLKGVPQAVWVPNAIGTAGNALIFQAPAPAHGTAPPTCALTNTRLVFTCTANNF